MIADDGGYRPADGGVSLTGFLRFLAWIAGSIAVAWLFGRVAGTWLSGEVSRHLGWLLLSCFWLFSGIKLLVQPQERDGEPLTPREAFVAGLQLAVVVLACVVVAGLEFRQVLIATHLYPASLP